MMREGGRGAKLVLCFHSPLLLHHAARLFAIICLCRLDADASEWECIEILNVVALDVTTSAGLHGLTLDLNTLSSLLCLLLDLLVLPDTVQEVISACALLHVLNTNMDLLADDAVTVELVHLDADGTWSDVPDDTSLTMVELVWQTLLDGTVTLDVDKISNFVCVQVGGERNVSMLAELAGKQVAGTRAVTEGVRHGELCI